MITLVADVHLGNHRSMGGASLSRMNDRFRETMRIFREACRRAAKTKALVVLGDLFDTDDPNPAMVREVLEAFKLGPKRVILLLGNHEMHSDQPHDHALASLNGCWEGIKVDVIDRPTMAWVDELPLCLVPYQPGQASEWLPRAIRDAGFSSAPPLLCLHLGIADTETAETEPWMMGCHDQVTVDQLDELIEAEGLAGVAAGNWHKHMLWDGDEPIFQCGALVPTGWNNQGGDEWYGSVGYWDGGRFTREVIPGPRYLKFTTHKDWLPYASNEEIRARIVVPASRVSVVREKIAADDPMGYVEVLADKATTHRRARSAAVAARSASDDQEALSEYVKRCEKPDGVESREVLESCRAYLMKES